MANVTLLVSKSCSACPSAKTLWKGMKVKYSFSYREIDIGTEAGQELPPFHPGCAGDVDQWPVDIYRCSSTGERGEGSSSQTETETQKP